MKLNYFTERTLLNLFLFEALLLTLHQSDVLVLILNICLLSFHRSDLTLKLLIFFYSEGKYIFFLRKKLFLALNMKVQEVRFILLGFEGKIQRLLMSTSHLCPHSCIHQK